MRTHTDTTVYMALLNHGKCNYCSCTIVAVDSSGKEIATCRAIRRMDTGVALFINHGASRTLAAIDDTNCWTYQNFIHVGTCCTTR